MTVFMIGIFDSFFFTVMLSVTNHGEISSRLVLPCRLVFGYLHIYFIEQFLNFIVNQTCLPITRNIHHRCLTRIKISDCKKHFIVAKFAKCISLWPNLHWRRHQGLSWWSECAECPNNFNQHILALLLFMSLVVWLLLIRFEL